jgi:tripartite-type tricarboxylate transporter receptor subunit TctC
VDQARAHGLFGPNNWQALRDAKVREAFEKLGATPAGGNQPEFADFIRSQVAHWSRVVREAGIKLPQL